jgi:Protein of unknown function (DUF3309)
MSHAEIRRRTGGARQRGAASDSGTERQVPGPTPLPVTELEPFSVRAVGRKSLEEMHMSLGTILLIILIIALIGALPTWPYSGGWGYYPSGGVGLIVIILIILLLMGRL